MPTPTVSGLHVVVPPAVVHAKVSLPQTGFAAVPKFVAVSVFTLVLGLYLCYLAALPARRPYRRRH